MEITVVGRNIAVTDALRGYAERKVSKLQRYFEREIVDAQVSMAVERGIHGVDVTIQVDGLLLRGEEKTGDMYASIDGAVSNIERQIEKYKTRINRKLRQAGNKLIESAMSPMLPAGAAAVEAPEPKVVKTKRFAIKPMSVEEAIMQMELLGHDFFVFMNSSSEDVNVVYRRKDGNYGLIEPEF
ncbi:MAG: ribosome-associated translation inhibitor RaiA [Clostridia bacterium]|nr:ribosome-associated translation inhibitor RaiA [Clostridia bacterium]